MFCLTEADSHFADCLKTLRFNNKRFENISLPHEYTFEWLWKTQEYTTWKSVEHSSLLFIEGKPGSGKSTLVKYFKNQFRDHFGTRPHNLDRALIAGFFYSNRDGELERSHYNMLRSLLYEILAADESFFIHFEAVFRRGDGCNISWRYEDLKDVLLACRKHPLRMKLFLIVDAIDESDENDRRDIAVLFQKLSDTTNTECVVKVILASRPINDLNHDFVDSCNHILLQDKNKEDIEKFTDAFLADQVFCRAEGLKRHAKEYIVQCADGVFLWVSLIRESLVRYVNQGRSVNQLILFLKALPRGLDSYYVRMLEALAKQHNGEWDDTNISDGRRILQFCLFSHRAIELVELEHALAISGRSVDPEPDLSSWEAETPTDTQKRVTHCAGDFVEIRYRPTLGPHGKYFTFLNNANKLNVCCSLKTQSDMRLSKSCISLCASSSSALTPP
jgi:hypothetical protein